ncbi:hypothetical protein BH10BAC5_BH10BAC5_02120 [soil metagenome]
MGAQEKEALMQRLDVFLDKLKARYTEIMDSASQPLDDVINNLQYDTIIIININTGLRDQAVNQLIQKAEEGFEKMSSQFYKLGFSGAEEKEAGSKVNDFKNFIQSEFTKYEVNIYAKAARKILSNVQQHINEKKLHRCTQCGAELPIKIYSFMSLNFKCESCGSVNTYVPDDRVRCLEYYVINYLADEKAMPNKLKGLTDKKANTEYLKEYFGYMIENIPEKKDQYERTLSARLGDLRIFR